MWAESGVSEWATGRPRARVLIRAGVYARVSCARACVETVGKVDACVHGLGERVGGGSCRWIRGRRWEWKDSALRNRVQRRSSWRWLRVDVFNLCVYWLTRVDIAWMEDCRA